MENVLISQTTYLTRCVAYGEERKVE